MRRLLASLVGIAFWVCPYISFAQVVTINEDFNDGDYSSNPAWTDTETKHIINASNLLQLDAPSADGEATISTPSTAAYGSWEAFVNLDFNPSSNNLSRFYILSDTQNMKGSIRGYYVEIGDSDDEISLYRQDGTERTKIIDGTDDMVNTDPVNVRIRVSRDLNGTWELLADTSGGTSFISQGTVTDNSYKSSSYIGLFSKYSSTRSALFAYDEILVTKIIPPLDIASTTIVDNKTVDIRFNLDINPSSVELSNFSVNNGSQNPDGFSIPSSDLIRLSYNSSLPSSRYIISVSNIDDTNGNTIASNSTSRFILFGQYTDGDVKINEFVADPPASPSSIQEEYVELINTSGKILNLSGWEIGDNSSKDVLQTDPVILEADSFLVVSSDTTALPEGRSYYELSALSSFNNDTDAVQLLNSSGTMVDSLTYNSDWGGTDIALERRSVTTPGTYSANWGNSPAPEGGTPGLPNVIAKDHSPPQLTALHIVSNQLLKAGFNERLQQPSANAIANYSLTNISIASVTQTAPDSVEISLDTSLQNALRYTLSISGITDIFGNTIAMADSSFTHYEISSATPNDIVINEIMAAPSSGSSEYVELYNHSTKSLDLQGWTIKDNTSGMASVITNNPFIIPPDSFVVITSDNTLMTNQPNIALVAMGSSFPTLNNGGDQIIIQNKKGQRLDSLTYHSQWVSDGIAMERRSVSVPSTFLANWGEAPNGFGTPGVPNEIASDTQPPSLESLMVEKDKLTITFSEQPEINSSTNPGHYNLPNGPPISTVNFTKPDSIFISLAGNLQNNTVYTLHIENVTDIFGNNIVPTDSSFTFYEVSPSDSGDVVINEFNYAPAEGEAEYVEIYNHSNKSFDLQQWTLSDNRNQQAQIAASPFVIPPDSFSVIAPDNTLTIEHPDIPLVVMDNFPSLNNSGDRILIRNGSGTLLDSLQYNNSWGGNEEALERRSPNLSAAYKSNWGVAPMGTGSPGKQNSISIDDEPPLLDALTVRDSRNIILEFSEELDQASAIKVSGYTLKKGPTVSNAVFWEPDSVLIQLGQALTNGTDYKLSVQGPADVFGNAISMDTTFSYYEISAIDSGNVFINEFNFEPEPGNTEYIEIYNPTGKSFDLQHLTLGDNRGNRASITHSQYVVPPDSFIVLAPDNTLLSTYPDISLVVMPNFPTLNNSGDRIVLRHNDHTLLDSLQYSEDWEEDGGALERRMISVSGIFAENWGPSPAPNTGTPGSTNAVERDILPPELVSYSIESASVLKLGFSEHLNPVSAIEITNYNLLNSSIKKVAHISPDSVELSLDTALKNTQSYTLTVSNIKDIFGNSSNPSDTTFNYYKVSPVAAGDIFINEFLANPPPSTVEYIELYNASDKSLNLREWTLNDNSGPPQSITDTRFIIPPDSFAVISSDQTLLSTHPDISLVTMNSRFPSLNNGSDCIVVRSSGGTLLDSLQYQSGWHNTDRPVERRTTNAPTIYKENWGQAESENGSPGRINDIKADISAPELGDFHITGQKQLKLIFNERLTSSSNGHNVSIDQNLAIENVSLLPPDTLSVSLTTAMQNNTNYTISATSITDIFGNKRSSVDTSFTFYKVSPSDSGDIAINEFMYIPAEQSSEYVELYNHSGKSLNLRGWTISDSRQRPIPLTDDRFIVPPDSFVVVAPDNTLQSVYPGISLLPVNSFPALNNGSDRIIIRNQQGTLLDSLTYYSSWGGDESALERRSTNVAALFAENWDTLKQHKGTPGFQNKIAPDQTSPVLKSLQIASGREIILRFNEQLNPALASEPKSYNISDAKIRNISFTPPDRITLSLSSLLKNNQNYTLDISNIEDLFSNTIRQSDTTFTYHKISRATKNDIFITEFNYDPSPGNTEYVELYNPTNQSFDLQNWTLSDNRNNRTTITDKQYILPPDSYLVIAPDNTLQSDYPDISLVVMQNFPSLNNSGDDIIIANAEGTSLDSLRFTSEWGGQNAALERRTHSVSANFRANWVNAANGSGSPGSINIVETDKTPPFFSRLYAINPRTLRLFFSEKITALSATDADNFDIMPSREIQLISAGDDSVTLYLKQPMTSGIVYSVTASNISDIFGNTLSGATQKFEYLKIDGARPGDIIVNEILYDPGSNESADFVELYNTTGKNLDLSHWYIGDNSSKTSIDQKLQLRAHSYLVLTGSRTFASQYKHAIFIKNFPSLNNSTDDAIYIQDKDERTIDSLQYSQSWGNDKEGTSLERKDPLAASNDSSNWQSNINKNFSVGQQNSRFTPDDSPPNIIFAKALTAGGFELYFDEFITLTKNLRFSSKGKHLDITNFDSTRGNIIRLAATAAKTTVSKGTAIRVQNLSDVKGNSTSTTKIPVAQPMHPSDVAINEIMYKPLDESDDNRPDQSEYIELRNTKDHAVSLEGLTLHDAPDEDGNVHELQPVTSTAKWIPSQGTMLIYADKSPEFKDSNVATFFGLPAPATHSLVRINRSSLSLASSNDAIYLADSSGTTIDSVYYDDSWHNPNIIDSRGIALERIVPDGPSNDDSNWGSSINKKGGTPHRKNSLYQENAQQLEESGMRLTPNPFSPDGDGNEDNLFINYQLDEQDYLISIHIYDRYGRLVRELADGKQAGLNGQIIWDGRKTDGSRNRIGIYIIVFEAYNSTTGQDKIFKKTVVLARKLN